MKLILLIVSAVGTLLRLAVMAVAIFGDLYNGCENGPCGSRLILVIPGLLIVLVSGGVGASVIRDERRSRR